MTNSISQTGYSVGIKVFLAIALTAGIFLSYWAGLTYIQEGKLYHLIAVVLPLLLFCTVGLWYTFKFRIVITDSYIEHQGLLKPKTLHFNRIEEVCLYENEMVLKGGRTKIRITSDLKNQKGIISQLLIILRSYQSIEVKGNKTLSNQ